MNTIGIGTPHGASSSVPATPNISLDGLDPTIVAGSGAVASVVASGAMFAALQAVDRSGRSSGTAGAASALLEIGSKQRLKALALVVGGAGAAAGTEVLSDRDRSLVVGAGIGALAAEGTHQAYSITFWPHGGAFNPHHMEDNLVARYARIESTAPDWQRGIARGLQRLVPK